MLSETKRTNSYSSSKYFKCFGVHGGENTERFLGEVIEGTTKAESLS